jgi:branched-chain amino acid transport system substrate-binding protein
MQIWVEDVNAEDGLLGRPVKLVYYDDQSNPAIVPGIYTKLLDVDKTDLVISGYATNQVAPAMPVVMQHNRLFFGLFGLAVNSEFHYPKYFSMLMLGPDPIKNQSQGYFDLAMAQTPQPKTIAIVAADAEFAKRTSDSARANAKAAGLDIVYDRSYPPTTVDYTPIVRAVQVTNPEIVFVARILAAAIAVLSWATGTWCVRRRADHDRLGYGTDRRARWVPRPSPIGDCTGRDAPKANFHRGAEYLARTS